MYNVLGAIDAIQTRHVMSRHLKILTICEVFFNYYLMTALRKIQYKGTKTKSKR